MKDFPRFFLWKRFSVCVILISEKYECENMERNVCHGISVSVGKSIYD